ncbi:MAG: hypothetical protein N3F06_03710 [Nitrososphaerales archaeon]|nr:hypothetical protein [Nitrososphaerales archaeon]
MNKKVLIVGDLNTGKTRLTAKLLNEAVEGGYSNKITVIDMAPSPSIRSIYGKVGERLESYTDYVRFVNYLKPDRVRAPRLEGRTSNEVLELARENAINIDKLITEFMLKPTEILFINDLSIYLHMGNIQRILQLLTKSKTFIANAYKGTSLKDDKGSGISKREEEMLSIIEKYMDLIVELK